MSKILDNLTLVIPAKNEQEALPLFLEELDDYKVKILIVISKNDMLTYEKIKKKKNIEVLFQEHEGYGSAIIEAVNKVQTNYMTIINADGSMNPTYLYQMLQKCLNNDFVFASRYESENSGSEDDTWLTFVGNKIFSLIGNILFKLNLGDILFTYILGKTKSFKKLNLKYKDFRLCVEIPIKAKKMKMNYSSIPNYERKRVAGIKKVNEFKDGFLILLGILSFIGKKYASHDKEK